MYVSMWEGRKAYFRNMARLGLDLPPLEKKNLFRFLEMPTLSAEGLPAIWEEIVRNIDEAGDPRFLIHSFSSMAQTILTQVEPPLLPHTRSGETIPRARRHL